ncbi:MAG: HisA/HisF-related TIM barrel protein [Firmicutes bacterium]|nr:HisA/HisF-related TIM barrel protein [Bacillota bacterium]
MFEIIPSVPIAFGRLVAEEPTAIPVSNPLAAAWHWMSVGASHIHVEDVGAMGGATQGPSVPALLIACRAGKAAVQVGGGIRSADVAVKYLTHGANALVLRRAWQDPHQWRAIIERVGAERVVLALSVAEVENVSSLCDGEQWRKGGVTRLLVAGHWTQRGLFVSQQRLLRRLTDSGYAVWVGGGIRHLETVRALRDAGVAGVVIGRALYQGKLSWNDLESLATDLSYTQSVR